MMPRYASTPAAPHPAGSRHREGGALTASAPEAIGLLSKILVRIVCHPKAGISDQAEAARALVSS
jgi:hypothetical protein